MKIERNENTDLLLESCEWDVDGIAHLLWKKIMRKMYWECLQLAAYG